MFPRTKMLPSQSERKKIHITLYCPFCKRKLKTVSSTNIRYKYLACASCGFGIKKDELYQVIETYFDPSYRSSCKELLSEVRTIGVKGNVLFKNLQDARET